jgi:hypothetical protein
MRIDCAVLARSTRRFAATLVLAALTGVFASVTGCDLWDPPRETSSRRYDPIVELFVVNSLAETLTSIELDGTGRFVGSQDDAAIVGSVPNAIIPFASGAELAITISGQNRVLLLDESTFVTTGAIDLGSGVNPMVTAEVRPSLFGTTGLFTGRLHLHDREGYAARDGSGNSVAPLTGPTDSRAPQAILAVTNTGGGAGEVRVLVTNTAYSSSRPSEYPFGAATLTAFRLAVAADAGTAGGAPQMGVVETVTYQLEASGDLPAITGDGESISKSGLNPQQIIDGPSAGASGEIVVVGAGVNYGNGGAGNDDGVVLVLDRGALIDGAALPAAGNAIVTRRVAIGGSPGAGVVLNRDDGGFTLITAGTTALRTVNRADAGTGTAWTEPLSSGAAVVYTATGGLPFLSDIAAWNDNVYVADFGNDRVLRFSWNGSGGLTYRESRGVSDGPIAVHVGVE